jgi:chloride channel protein, CIC family
VIVLLGMRTTAVSAALAGGGAGGVFIPLVVEGALLGRVFSSLSGHPGSSLFPIIGIAAFLGAGYRVPLAAVMFVAESTGRPEFVVPGLIAAVVGQLVMGKASVTSYQRGERQGNLERRLALPLANVLRKPVETVPPDTTLAEMLDQLVVDNRPTRIPVVDGTRYIGVAQLDELIRLPSKDWPHLTVKEIINPGWPIALPNWTMGQALASMQEADTDILPVVDRDGAFVGIATAGDILRLDELREHPDP